MNREIRKSGADAVICVLKHTGERSARPRIAAEGPFKPSARALEGTVFAGGINVPMTSSGHGALCGGAHGTAPVKPADRFGRVKPAGADTAKTRIAVLFHPDIESRG